MEDPESNKPSLLERLSAFLLREPEDREQLIQLLHSAYERNLLDADALSMMEGVLQVSERQVREIMMPRAQMDVIDISEPPEQFIPFVIDTAHSRFPVTDGDKDYATNVLTFVYDDEGVLSGDVVICAPVVEKEAHQQHKDLLAHYAHLAIHAALHL